MVCDDAAHDQLLKVCHSGAGVVWGLRVCAKVKTKAVFCRARSHHQFLEKWEGKGGEEEEIEGAGILRLCGGGGGAGCSTLAQGARAGCALETGGVTWHRSGGRVATGAGEHGDAQRGARELAPGGGGRAHLHPPPRTSPT